MLHSVSKQNDMAMLTSCTYDIQGCFNLLYCAASCSPLPRSHMLYPRLACPDVRKLSASFRLSVLPSTPAGVFSRLVWLASTVMHNIHVVGAKWYESLLASCMCQHSGDECKGPVRGFVIGRVCLLAIWHATCPIA